MSVADDIRKIERDLKGNITLARFLCRVGIPLNTWIRYRNGETEPRVSKWQLIKREHAAIVRENRKKGIL